MSKVKAKLCGILEGHSGHVTSLATTGGRKDLLVSGSRDKTVIVWKIPPSKERGAEDADERLMSDHEEREIKAYGRPEKSLHGHSHFVSDVVLSADGRFALSSSWDGTLRLWDLVSGCSTKRFVGHSNDVLSVAFSPENRQIVSASRDRSIRLWNTLGECKYVFDEEKKGHSEWVSCVCFSPDIKRPIMVSCGWDRLVKVWDLAKVKLLHTLSGHTGYINAIGISPDGSLCASGGKDAGVMLWDLCEAKNLFRLDTGGSIINALAFSPKDYLLCAATDASVKVWDLEKKELVLDLTKDNTPGFDPASKSPAALSLAWSAGGDTIFVGYSDNKIRAFEISKKDPEKKTN